MVSVLGRLREFSRESPSIASLSFRRGLTSDESSRSVEDVDIFRGRVFTSSLMSPPFCTSGANPRLCEKLWAAALMGEWNGKSLMSYGAKLRLYDSGAKKDPEEDVVVARE